MEAAKNKCCVVSRSRACGVHGSYFSKGTRVPCLKVTLERNGNLFLVLPCEPASVTEEHSSQRRLFCSSQCSDQGVDVGTEAGASSAPAEWVVRNVPRKEGERLFIHLIGRRWLDLHVVLIVLLLTVVPALMCVLCAL